MTTIEQLAEIERHATASERARLAHAERILREVDEGLAIMRAAIALIPTTTSGEQK